MARRRRNFDPSSDDSDSSERESTEDGHYDTDLTEPEDEGSQDKDVSDAALLFADNEHPPEYYIQQLANFDETDYTKEDYGKGTTALLNRVEEKWSQFCAFLRKDPREEFTRLSISIMYIFLDWVLNLQRGKDGRRLPGTKCKSSLDTSWKVFRLVYERETSNKITKQMNRQMRRVRSNMPSPEAQSYDPNDSSLSRTGRGADAPWRLGDSTAGQETQTVLKRVRQTADGCRGLDQGCRDHGQYDEEEAWPWSSPYRTSTLPAACWPDNQPSSGHSESSVSPHSSQLAT